MSVLRRESEQNIIYAHPLQSLDVVLSFPHKDHILKGGQSREDQRSQDVFYHPDMDREAVDCLLAPKAFAGVTRYKAQGCERDSRIEAEDNLVIKGDNLPVLASLQSSYEGRVKMIYWDIPYNTGSDSFGYNDRFDQTSWLVFMKNRVEAALPLLDPDKGVFLIQCSFHGYPYLKVLLDEIIGNYAMTFHVLVRHPDRTLTGDKSFNDVIEYILVYAASPNFRMPKKRVEKTVDDYRWIIRELSEGEPVDFDGRKGRIFLPDQYEMVRVEPGADHLKVVSVRGSLREKVSSGRFYVKYLEPLETVYPAKTLFKVEGIGADQYDYRYFYLPPEGNRNGAYLQGMPVASPFTYKPYPNFLDFVRSYNTVSSEGEVSFRNGKKPEALLTFLMDLFTEEGDLVLDAFAGSGTTGAVALKMGRRFILCEQMDYIKDVTVKRLSDLLPGLTGKKYRGLTDKECQGFAGKECQSFPDQPHMSGRENMQPPSFVYMELARAEGEYINYNRMRTEGTSLEETDIAATESFYRKN